MIPQNNRKRFNKTGPKPIPIEDRFWEKVDVKNNIEECWEWLASKDGHGRGVIRYDGKNKRAHAIAYLLYYGNLDSNLNVLHKCDTPLCCNPHHLKQGTQAENMQECRDRGRSYVPGARKKLDWKKVREIRYLRQVKGFTTYKLGEMFGVSRVTIGHIINNKTWVETKRIARDRYSSDLKRLFDGYDSEMEAIALQYGFEVPKSIYLW